MNPKSFTLPLTLTGLWGASFLFIRIGAPAFGPVPLMTVHVLIAAIFLSTILWLKHGGASGFRQMSGKLGVLFVIGVLNQALPFCLFAYAELTLPAGVTSVMNATTPLWAAIVAFIWIGNRLNGMRIIGLIVGFSGVLILVYKDISGLHAMRESLLALIAALGAALFYGVSANAIKKFLAGVDSLTIVTGCMIGTAVALLPFAFIYWPSTPISTHAWISVIALGGAYTPGSLT